MSSPKITALMTTYNCAQFVEATIQSVLEQSYPFFTFLIIDDGSTDNTCELISNFEDPRIEFHQFAENRGIGCRLNEALSLIKTPYIVKVDGDDISAPNRFEKQLEYLENNPELDIIKCLIEYFSDDPEVLKSERFENFITVRAAEHNALRTPKQIAAMTERWSSVIHSSIFARSDVLKKLGYPPSRVGEDYNVMYRAIASGFNIGCIPETLLQVRLSQTSTTTQQQSPMHFARMLFDLKKEKISRIAEAHGAIWIYGSGGLARAFAERLIHEGFALAGFLDRNPSSLTISEKRYEVRKLSADSERGVVIAAQPVRAEILHKLIDFGWEEWRDFMVLA